MSYGDMVAIVKRATSSIVDRWYPSRANREKMSLYDLIAFGVMAHACFNGVYKRAYRFFVKSSSSSQGSGIIRLLKGSIVCSERT